MIHLAGMWDFNNFKNRTFADQLFMIFVNKSISTEFGETKRADQVFLARVVYPLVKSNSTIHDSFCCKRFNDSIPFPTKRKDLFFIGSVGINKLVPPYDICPKECRPKLHQDWLNC